MSQTIDQSPHLGMRIRRAKEADFENLVTVINDAAEAYRGAIPSDRWQDPYMPTKSLLKEIKAGVDFWVAEEDGRLLGIMGIQDRGEVALIRHAYVLTESQGMGIGKLLLQHVLGLSSKTILVGTWAAASWAIRFYQRNGFSLLTEEKKNSALDRYWDVPSRQVETSVVLRYQANMAL